MKFVTVFNLLVIASIAQGEYPSNVPKCKYGDSPCLIKAADEVVKKYSSGLREINLIPFEPLRIKGIGLDKNPTSPVNVEIKLKDVEVFGLKNMKIISFTGFNSDLSGRSSFETMIPDLDLRGQYTIDGHVIILPITGEGPVQMNAKNVHLKFSFDLKPIEKNGQVFATLEHVKLEMTPEIVKFNFENLFNGDKALGDTTNKFLNENWREIYGELSPSFSKALSLVAKTLISGIFEKYPYAEYFL